ncbi:MAG: hypothetical protein LC745_05685 [Planctomycetia bacterium]|nr:hypothetical protein [Planctomycetia bacterium]
MTRDEANAALALLGSAPWPPAVTATVSVKLHGGAGGDYQVSVEMRCPGVAPLVWNNYRPVGRSDADNLLFLAVVMADEADEPCPPPRWLVETKRKLDGLRGKVDRRTAGSARDLCLGLEAEGLSAPEVRPFRGGRAVTLTWTAGRNRALSVLVTGWYVEVDSFVPGRKPSEAKNRACDDLGAALSEFRAAVAEVFPREAGPDELSAPATYRGKVRGER